MHAYTSNSSTILQCYLFCNSILYPRHYWYCVRLRQSTIENYFERKPSSNAVTNGNIFLYMHNYVSNWSSSQNKTILTRSLPYNVNRWSIKPIYGLITDFVPICSYHRFLYLLGTTTINFLAWLALYLSPIEYDYLLVFCVLAAFSLAFNDVLSKISLFLFTDFIIKTWIIKAFPIKLDRKTWIFRILFFFPFMVILNQYWDSVIDMNNFTNIVNWREKRRQWYNEFFIQSVWGTKGLGLKVSDITDWDVQVSSVMSTDLYCFSRSYTSIQNRKYNIYFYLWYLNSERLDHLLFSWRIDDFNWPSIGVNRYVSGHSAGINEIGIYCFTNSCWIFCWPILFDFIFIRTHQ